MSRRVLPKTGVAPRRLKRGARVLCMQGGARWGILDFCCWPRDYSTTVPFTVHPQPTNTHLAHFLPSWLFCASSPSCSTRSCSTVCRCLVLRCRLSHCCHDDDVSIELHHQVGDIAISSPSSPSTSQFLYPWLPQRCDQVPRQIGHNKFCART